jgi:phosphomannomutase
VNPRLLERAVAWMVVDPDDGDRAQIQRLIDEDDEAELSRRFDAPLRFGTAGLRGPVMAGPAGMNRCSVRRATQGVVAWLAEIGADRSAGVVVGRDARRGSEDFNDETIAVLLGAGIAVWEMPEPAPTPLVAYAVRALGAAAGVMITASHNPPQDNGYKLYGANGAQIIPPTDEIVERFAASAASPVLADRSSPLHRVVPDSLFEAYEAHFVARFGVPGGSDLEVTYTPLHGVGGTWMARLFAAAGYRRVHLVDRQFKPDGTFPTLPFPNPEEPGALDLAIATARATRSSVVIANDPDADRLGVALREGDDWRVLRGDQIGWLLASMLLDTAAPGEVVATTLVSSTMLCAMAAAAGVRCVTTLTGFKWISRAGGEGALAFGYEEALGFAVDPVVADKDGMSAALALCRLAHDLARQDKTLLDRLDEIEARFGVHGVDQLALRTDGPGGSARIAAALRRLRDEPPALLGGLVVEEVVDLRQGYRGVAPTEGVLLSLAGGARVVVRPSGTEAKLKAYLEVASGPGSVDGLAARRGVACTVLASMRDDLAARLTL